MKKASRKAGRRSGTLCKIRWLGTRSCSLPQERGIGFVFQNYALFKHMTVAENIAFGLNVQRKSKAFIKNRVDELLELTGLKGFERRYPHQLSGGQRQRVAFARALAPEPQLLLLDEPFAAIDAKVRKELRVWLREMISLVGITSIFVTHDQEEAVEVADEIMIVSQGRLEQKGSPWDIYQQPQSEFVAGFIGESNFLENELFARNFEGATYNIVVPKYTIRIDNPVALVDKNVDKHGNREVAESFGDFLWTKAAQQAFGERGFPPGRPGSGEAVREGV
jgi:sulfate/thiosulfate transport system ATP-binding protein